MNGKEHTSVSNLVILLAEGTPGTSGTSGTSGDELTMPELAGMEKLMLIIYYYCQHCLFPARFPYRSLLHYAYIFCPQGMIAVTMNGLWGLGALFLEVECFFFFLRPCGLR